MPVTENQYVAQIVENETGDVVRQSEPTSRRRAERIEDGMGINLNWEKFSTRLVPASQTTKEV